MTKKKTAITLFTVAAISMVLVATLAIYTTLNADDDISAIPVAALGDTLYPVTDDGFWGFANADGAIVIPIIYDEVTTMTGNCAWVCLDGIWGGINQVGEVVVDFIYDSMEVINYQYMVCTSGSTTALFSQAGEKIFGIEGTIGSYSEGYFTFSRNKSDELLWGVIDKTGSIVIEPLYYAISSVRSGYVMVEAKTGEKTILDMDGAIVASLDLSYALVDFGEGSILYQDATGLYGYKNFSGQEVIAAQWHYATAVINNMSLVKRGDYYGLINSLGVDIIANDYDYGEKINDSLYYFEKDDIGYLVDNTGIIASNVIGWGEVYDDMMSIYFSDHVAYYSLSSGLVQLNFNIPYDFKVVANMFAVIGDDFAIYYNQTGEVAFAVQPELEVADVTMDFVIESVDNALKSAYPVFTSIGEADIDFNSVNDDILDAAFLDWEWELSRYDDEIITVNSTFNEVADLMNVVITAEITDFAGDVILSEVQSVNFSLSTGDIYYLSDLFLGGYGWRSEMAEYCYNIYVNGGNVNLELLTVMMDPFDKYMPFELVDGELILYFMYGAKQDIYTMAIPLVDIDEKLDKESDLYLSYIYEEARTDD